MGENGVLTLLLTPLLNSTYHRSAQAIQTPWNLHCPSSLLSNGFVPIQLGTFLTYILITFCVSIRLQSI